MRFRAEGRNNSKEHDLGFNDPLMIAFLQASRSKVKQGLRFCLRFLLAQG